MFMSGCFACIYICVPHSCRALGGQKQALHLPGFDICLIHRVTACFQSASRCASSVFEQKHCSAYRPKPSALSLPCLLPLFTLSGQETEHLTRPTLPCCIHSPGFCWVLFYVCSRLLFMTVKPVLMLLGILVLFCLELVRYMTR